MNKELYELLNKMRERLLHGCSIELSRKELSMVIRYINELEREISEGIDEWDIKPAQDVE